MKLSNWGQYPVIETDLKSPRRPAELASFLEGDGPLIARGLGRCYGDASLQRRILSMTGCNRFLAFDEETGELTCEAGLSLDEIVRVLLPRGWFLPVTPGTRFVTVGGAIASDVHGKNHHLAGTFGDAVSRLELMDAAGRIHVCSPTENRDLFMATRGGMGLTGLILRASFRLIRVETAYIRQEVVRAPDLDGIMRLFEESASWTYSVAWIDCLAGGASLGRSVLMRGEHARRAELPDAARLRQPLMPPPRRKLTVPFNLPALLLNPWTVQAFNAVYYRKAPGLPHMGLIDYDAFFYPLDAIHHWNRIYGARGFTQYQCVLPKAASHDALVRILHKIHRSHQGSFLAVLKLFGQPRAEAPLSFPREGYTLALDFAMQPKLAPLLAALDEEVLAAGGRLYLAKDARQSAATFAAGYPELEAFRVLKRRIDPEARFHSLQSQRLEI
ncbi:MAG: FAD-binding oxidoreductase [Magnetococcales bacterium]|nr:FAD-binding oxidoreductase [Magnetococcales bacterium]